MSKQSLISKIAEKQVLTPLELVTLQYVDRRHLGESCQDVREGENPYLVVENIPPLIAPQELKKLLYIGEPRKQRAYEYYQWLSNLLINLDNASAEVGNRGIALLNELRYCQSERAVQLLLQEEELEIDTSLEKFTIFSHIHNKQMTYLDLIESFGRTFRDLIIITDNVLTANLDLEEMVDLEELKCLQYLQTWFTGECQPNEEEDLSTQPSAAQICYDNIFSTIIDQNHPDFVELLQTKVELAGYKLFSNFKEGSMIYVRNTITAKVENVKEKETQKDSL